MEARVESEEARAARIAAWIADRPRREAEELAEEKRSRELWRASAAEYRRRRREEIARYWAEIDRETAKARAIRRAMDGC